MLTFTMMVELTMLFKIYNVSHSLDFYLLGVSFSFAITMYCNKVHIYPFSAYKCNPMMRKLIEESSKNTCHDGKK